ncbi:peptidylprolyl isomerase [Caulobacter sp. 17J80-11]|uniref:peptidylprolyl isomerase n=1 Tax=Caulobacter sp. 17J80-11 TaxID=2763502 RepID=UPI001653AB32|nr:peptidylprolyl isomerase [Caulobacter sp. 17J80-11]MBC6981199.1 peptidylprolyl isomerase [Caulobacter sp. 17J80-11]
MPLKAVLFAAALALAVPAAASAAGPVPTWRTVEPDDAWVIDTSKGRVVVELAPEIAPSAVERIKLLTREGLYDGLEFHRVIDWFMAQTGDPGNVDGGKSSHPDLKPEFTFRRGPQTPFAAVANPYGTVLGFVQSVPVQGNPDAAMARASDGKASAWGLYCQGVVGMGRGEAEDSANSEFFLMRQPYPALDKRYTVVGRVVVGLDVVRKLKTGEPVNNADTMVKVRMLSDIPAAERPTVQVMDVRSAEFAARVEKARTVKGADFSPCDLEIPARVK